MYTVWSMDALVSNRIGRAKECLSVAVAVPKLEGGREDKILKS